MTVRFQSSPHVCEATKDYSGEDIDAPISILAPRMWGDSVQIFWLLQISISILAPRMWGDLICISLMEGLDISILAPRMWGDHCG